MELTLEQISEVLREVRETHDKMFISEKLEKILLKQYPDAIIWFITFYSDLLEENNIEAAYFSKIKTKEIFNLFDPLTYELKSATVKKISNWEVFYKDGEKIPPSKLYRTLYQELIDPQHPVTSHFYDITHVNLSLNLKNT
jgi:hypothetical protein